MCCPRPRGSRRQRRWVSSPSRRCAAATGPGDASWAPIRAASTSTAAPAISGSCAASGLPWRRSGPASADAPPPRPPRLPVCADDDRPRRCRPAAAQSTTHVPAGATPQQALPRATPAASPTHQTRRSWPVATQLSSCHDSSAPPVLACVPPRTCTCCSGPVTHHDGRVGYHDFQKYMNDKELQLYRIFLAIDVEFLKVPVVAHLRGHGGQVTAGVPRGCWLSERGRSPRRLGADLDMPSGMAAAASKIFHAILFGRSAHTFTTRKDRWCDGCQGFSMHASICQTRSECPMSITDRSPSIEITETENEHLLNPDICEAFGLTLS